MARLRTRRARVVAVIVVVALVAVLAFAALTIRLFVYPDLNTPERASAIVVLGGQDFNTSFNEAVALAERGYAPTLAVSHAWWNTCEPYPVRLHNVHVLCFEPNPATTQGEARAIGHLAALHHWHRVIVVTRTTQATRARLRIGRCYAGQVMEVGVTPGGLTDWAYQIAYEWGALMKALVLQTSC